MVGQASSTGLTYDITDAILSSSTEATNPSKWATATLSSNGTYTKDDENLVITQNKAGNYLMRASTKEVNPDMLKANSDVVNINLGLGEREHPDVTLGNDLENVKVSVNGYTHTYNYDQRYDKNALTMDDSKFNIGVKFADKYSGNYFNSIYTSDYEYTPNNDADKNELKLYVTYQIRMGQGSVNLDVGINSIVDYFDKEYEVDKVYRLDNNQEIELKNRTEDYNDQYKKLLIEDPSSVHIGGGVFAKKYSSFLTLSNQEEQKIYIRFKLSKQQVRDLLNNKGGLLNNIAEINSYSVRKHEQAQPYAGIDINSNPGNCIPGNKTTYENDTSASPALQLKVENAREMTGKVFKDETMNVSGFDKNEVMKGQIRKGNGYYQTGEEGIGDVTVTLKEDATGYIYKTTTVKEDGKYFVKKQKNSETEYTMNLERVNDNDSRPDTHELKKGDFYIIEYIPGEYTLTYTWGDQEYKVQNYKGTNYNVSRNKDGKDWWKIYNITIQNGEEKKTKKYTGPPRSFRETDAIDDYEIRKAIDEQMKEVDKNTRQKIEEAYQGNDNGILTKMNSSTPPMEIGVEYESVYSASSGRKYSYCIDELDFGITERPKQDLVLEKRIAAMKVTLAGRVIANITKENGDWEGDMKYIAYMKPDPNMTPKNGTIKLELDTELMQGAELEITYEIKAINNSEKDYIPKEGADAKFYKYGTIDETQEIVMIKPTGIIDYLDKNWAFDKEKNEQITEIKTDIKDLVKDEVLKDSNSTVKEKMFLYTKYLENNELKPTESAKITYNVSKLLTTTDDISLKNEAEEVKVNKTGGSLIQTTPGSYIPGKGIQETDETMAETIKVIPATGKDLNYIVPIAIGITALIVLGTGIIVIKKKVLS